MGSDNSKPLPYWKPDASASHCEGCHAEFGLARRRHHCRCCGGVFCGKCSDRTAPVPTRPEAGSGPQRVCETCFEDLQDAGPDGIAGPGNADAPGQRSERFSNRNLPPIAVESPPLDALPPVAPAPAATGSGGPNGSFSQVDEKTLQQHYEAVLQSAAGEFADAHAVRTVCPGELELEPCEDVPELSYAAPIDGQLPFPAPFLGASADAGLTDVLFASPPVVPGVVLALHGEVLEKLAQTAQCQFSAADQDAAPTGLAS